MADDPTFRVIDDDALAELRAINNANLPHRASVTMQATSGTRVGGALVPVTPTTVLDDVPCRLVPLAQARANEVAVADQPDAQANYVLVFEAGVVIPRGAEATVTGTSLATGEEWTRKLVLG